MVAAQAASSKTARGNRSSLSLTLGDLIGITDHFVISSRTQRSPGARDRRRGLQKQLRDNFNLRGCQVEGMQGDNKWVLLDYGDFVVHVFDNESRDMYSTRTIVGRRQAHPRSCSNLRVRAQRADRLRIATSNSRGARLIEST